VVWRHTIKRMETKGQMARSGFGHLGGKPGNRLFGRLIALGGFGPEEGRTTVYRITDQGREELAGLGVSLDWIGRGPETAPTRREKSKP